MVIGPDTSRQARPQDFDEIDALLAAAFGRRDEADLVRRLRADGAIVLEVVKCWHDRETGQSRIGAYMTISRMVAPQNWFCLGPVAVLPEWQNGALDPDDRTRGSFRFGSRLVREYAELFAQGGDWWTELLARQGLLQGHEQPTLVVVGKPSFYARAGFSLDRAARLTTPYPLHVTLIARPGNDVPERALTYPPAFAGL
jgi:putative acetyltransferase